MASDATATRALLPLATRVRRARKPGMPAMRAAMPRGFFPSAVKSSMGSLRRPNSRSSRRLGLTSPDWRIASTALTLPARLAGAQALMSRVTTESATTTASARASTLTGTAVLLPTSTAQPSPVAAKAA